MALRASPSMSLLRANSLSFCLRWFSLARNRFTLNRSRRCHSTSCRYSLLKQKQTDNKIYHRKSVPPQLLKRVQLAPRTNNSLPSFLLDGCPKMTGGEERKHPIAIPPFTILSYHITTCANKLKKTPCHQWKKERKTIQLLRQTTGSTHRVEQWSNCRSKQLFVTQNKLKRIRSTSLSGTMASLKAVNLFIYMNVKPCIPIILTVIGTKPAVEKDGY